MTSLSEVTTIDRQKYVAELGKLLSGMARADREAVLRGVNARFDEANDDDAVIAALGSPTFAAVSVLRGYTPPEDSDGEDYYEEETYQYVEPAGASQPDEASAVPEAEAVSDEPGLVAPEETPESLSDAIEESQSDTGAVPDTAPDEPEEDAPFEAEPAPEQDAIDEAAYEVSEEAVAPEPVSDAPEAESGEPDDLYPGQVAPEAGVEQLSDEPVGTADEPDAEADDAEPEVPIEEVAPEPETDEDPVEPDAYTNSGFETVDLGLDTIEVYSDAPTQTPEEPETAAEAESEYAVDEPPFDAEEPETDYDAGAGYEPEDDEGFYPEPPEPERPKMRGGRVFVCVLLGLVPGVPVVAFLVLLSLALLITGVALAYAGGVFISFAFLGMGVVADILLTVGFGLMVAAIGVPVIFLAIWFFVRCVVGLFNKVFERAGAWCRGEEREQ